MLPSFPLWMAWMACSPESDRRAASPCRDCDELPATTQFARLTSLQWENAVHDLLQLTEPTGLSDTFLGDPLTGGFENQADALAVSPGLWQDYQRAAETLALRVTTEPELYARVVPEDPRSPPREPISLKVEAEDSAAHATVGIAIEGGWLMRKDGELMAELSLPASGRYELLASVWADQDEDGVVEAALGLDGELGPPQVVTEVSQVSAQRLSLFVEAEAGRHTVHVAFLNPSEEPAEPAPGQGVGTEPEVRTLYVDWVGADSAWSPLGEGVDWDGPTRDAWIGRFGRLAHRRPLTPHEIARYADLFARGPDLVASGDDGADGVRLVLSAMLQSPHFLYRVERGQPGPPGAPVPLTAHELASRLSFALWNTSPDAELRQSADSGALLGMAEMQRQARRLIEDERARETVADLHRQLLLLDSYENIDKDPALYPAFGPEVPEAMQAEALAFVDHVVFGDGSVRALYTEPTTFVNRWTAPLYGLPGTFTDELVQVELDPSERAGLLTLSGFLALHADPYLSSPIRRGSFINRAALCVELPARPDNTDAPPPEGDFTTRELVEAYTGEGTCGEGCHSTLINPPGYALESFDALGQHRLTENGQPIDDASVLPLPSGTLEFESATDFLLQLAEARETHRCYAQHLLQYVHGRAVTDEDDALLHSLSHASRAEDQPIRELVLQLVLAESFRLRRSEVTP
jgi:hypothetical protein